ncbi:hypothetical protein [Ferrimonas gelatinilytica]|uniref:Uncharacterized protein n=1 Tax=Ferrimonas gelatinilytica TaxID=1255257 RepID=A0ABP9RYA9_9GAMM
MPETHEPRNRDPDSDHPADSSTASASTARHNATEPSRSLVRFRQGLGWLTLALCVVSLLLSMLRWPTLHGVLAGYLDAPIGAPEVWAATTVLLLLNLLWLGAGAFLAIALIRGRRLRPWIYFLCTATLLFGGLFSKILAGSLILLRLYEEARAANRSQSGSPD